LFCSDGSREEKEPLGTCLEKVKYSISNGDPIDLVESGYEKMTEEEKHEILCLSWIASTLQNRQSRTFEMAMRTALKSRRNGETVDCCPKSPFQPLYFEKFLAQK